MPTDPPGSPATPRPARSPASLTIRLTAAFVAVALLAVTIVAGLAVVLSGQRLDTMLEDRQAHMMRSLRATAMATYDTAGAGWSSADWQPALKLAEYYETDAAVLDRDGRVLASTRGGELPAEGSTHWPISVRGEPVGTLVVDFTGGLARPVNDLRGSMLTAVVVAAGLAAGAALLVAWAVSRRLTGPLTQLIAAADSMRTGARDIRVGPVGRSPRELRELATTFDAMAESLGRQEKLRRALVAEVAHELRTPVAVLQANLEALADGIVEHTPEQTASLHEEVLRLAGRVADLQSLAHADAAALSLHTKPCDLARLTGAVVDKLVARGYADDLEVTCTLASAPVEADPGRLDQVITNIVINAFKYTAAGGRVEIDVHVTDRHAHLLVRDTGRGISPADLPHVFERFWRSSTTAGIEGTGIGLTIVDQLVEAHGGTVDIESEVGNGTAVTIRLPLRRPRRPDAPLLAFDPRPGSRTGSESAGP